MKAKIPTPKQNIEKLREILVILSVFSLIIIGGLTAMYGISWWSYVGMIIPLFFILFEKILK